MTAVEYAGLAIGRAFGPLLTAAGKDAAVGLRAELTSLIASCFKQKEGGTAPDEPEE